ncbi:MAG TPA: hypothetical protein VE078_01810 [Thermoanaerobaculia bacterium]|nr:hypothetical protein [Thermoanaerobaculia bacterium]
MKASSTLIPLLLTLIATLAGAAPPAIPGTVSLLTLVGGETVWDAGVLAPD